VRETLLAVDTALTLLGVSPGDIQICTGNTSRFDAQRPAIILLPKNAANAANFDHLVASLKDVYPREHSVSLIAGLATETPTATAGTIGTLTELPSDALYIPAIDPLDDVRRFDGLFHIVVDRLNAPDGCPWDNEQTHETLRPYLIEESYELIESIDEGAPKAIAEELGDVLLQVLMHTGVANRSGAFTFGDITESISRKMIHRHPHVFGNETYRPNWQDLKKQENPERSVLDGVPAALPALSQSQTIQSRARKVGFDWPDVEGPLSKLAEELGEFARADSDAEREDEFGDIVFVVVNVADHLGIDAEQALRLANRKFRRRFMRVEELAREQEIELKAGDLDQLNRLWDLAKADIASDRL